MDVLDKIDVIRLDSATGTTGGWGSTWGDLSWGDAVNDGGNWP